MFHAVWFVDLKVIILSTNKMKKKYDYLTGQVVNRYVFVN